MEPINKPLTMKDLARDLGVSVSTVSRALSGSAAISAEVREHVVSYAHSKGFTPNALAARLRHTKQQPTKVIGVIVPEIVHFYFSTILSGIESEANRRGYSLLVAQSNESYEREVEICQRFMEQRVCGVIVSQAKDTAEYSHFNRLMDNGCRLVFYDRICTGINASRVVVDDYDGAFHAVSHLIETGCKRIAFFGSRPNMEITKNRYNGYADALLQAGLPIDDELVINCDTDAKATELIPTIFGPQSPLSAPPDALFCINDDTAVSAVHALKRMGIRIPQEVSICGFANDNLSRACDPQLTTVEQRGTEVGRLAAEILISQVEGDTPNPHPIKRIVRTNLIIRGTTKNIN